MIVSVDGQIALLSSFKENLPPPTMVLWFSGSVLVFGFNRSLNSTKLHSYSGAKQILAGAINKQNKGFYVPLAGNRKEKDNYDLPFTTSSRSSIARRTTQKLWTMSNYINIFSISPPFAFSFDCTTLRRITNFLSLHKAIFDEPTKLTCMGSSVAEDLLTQPTNCKETANNNQKPEKNFQDWSGWSSCSGTTAPTGWYVLDASCLRFHTDHSPRIDKPRSNVTTIPTTTATRFRCHHVLKCSITTNVKKKISSSEEYSKHLRHQLVQNKLKEIVSGIHPQCQYSSKEEKLK